MNKPSASATVPRSGIKRFSIGVDIGGTNCEIGLVDDEGRCFARRSEPTRAHEPFSLFASRFLNMVKEQLSRLDAHYYCSGMGIAIPGTGPAGGNHFHASNFSWRSVDLMKEFRPHFNFPIHVINDANAAAIGEKEYGVARDFETFAVITLGTGLGGGVFINGKPLSGAHGMAGEFGHMEAVANGRQCACGKRGCLETYASATGLRRTVMELIAHYGGVGHAFHQLGYEELTAKAICDAAQAGDALAIEAFQRTGHILGARMADLSTVFDPQAFILFGGLTGAGPLLLEPVKAAFKEHQGKLFTGDTPILLSGAPHNEAAILGACHILDYT